MIAAEYVTGSLSDATEAILRGAHFALMHGEPIPMRTALQSSSEDIDILSTLSPLLDVQTELQATARPRPLVGLTPPAARMSRRRGVKIVLTLTLAMLGGVGISQGLLHGFATESMWLVAWGVALLASAAGVKRTIPSDADGPTLGARQRVSSSYQPAARTSPFSV
jgi:hypothetical protein